MIPTDTRSEPAAPGSAPAVDAGTPLLPPAAGDTSYPGIKPSELRQSLAPLISLLPMAATNIPIAAYWRAASNRHWLSAPTNGSTQSP